MFRLGKSTAGAVFAILYGCSTVSAAVISGPNGSVLINKGNGFVGITGNVDLAPGGQVMVQPGAVATISYANNCRVRVGSGLWTVQDAAPCANGAGEIDLTGRMNQMGPGDDGAHGVHPLLIGGLAIGGGLLIGCLVSWCKDHDKSASK
jgi:hypothetical protein